MQRNANKGLFGKEYFQRKTRNEFLTKVFGFAESLLKGLFSITSSRHLGTRLIYALVLHLKVRSHVGALVSVARAQRLGLADPLVPLYGAL